MDAAKSDGLGHHEPDEHEGRLRSIQYRPVPTSDNECDAHKEDGIWEEVAWLDVGREETRPLDESNGGSGEQYRSYQADDRSAERDEFPCATIDEAEQDDRADDGCEDGADGRWQLELHRAHPVEVRGS